MKSLLVALFAVIVSGTTVHAESTETAKTPIIPVEHKVVEIHMSAAPVFLEEMKKKRGAASPMPYVRSGTCSGAFIDNTGDIITAKHCVDGFIQFEIVTYDAKKYEAVVVATSSIHDLAIIHIDRRNTAFFELADKITRGEKVFALGSPLGITDTLSTGVVARVDGDMTFLDCAVLPGNSGGPLYNAEEKLVGVVSAGFIVYLGTTHLNVAQGLDAVSYFIEKTLGEKK